MLIFAGELLILYFLSRWVTQALFTLFMVVFRTRSVAVALLLAMQFPGTVIHELSHLFTAEILGVKTGRMRLEPESIREDSITAGSVMIAESDPFRRYAIGLAPLSWGIMALMAMAYVMPNLTNLTHWTDWLQWKNLAYGYLIFAVSNTMFPSPQDTQGFWPFAIAVSLFLIGGYAVGLRIELSGVVLLTATQLLTTLTSSLGVVTILNISLLVCIKIFLQIFTRVFRIRIV